MSTPQTPVVDAPMPRRLSEAMMDAEGKVYGTGHVRIARAGANAPEVFEGDVVQLRPIGTESLGFAMGIAQRDPRTGYLVADYLAVEDFPPAEVGTILFRALRTLVHPPLTFAVDKEGRMETPRGDRQAFQGLSDWRGSVTDVGERRVLTVSAALRSLLPLGYPEVRDDEELVEGEEPSRLEIEVSIDPVTRVLRFGGYAASLESGPAREPAEVIHTSLDEMRLASTPIGLVGAVYGVTDDGRWVNFYESRSTGQVTISGPVSRCGRSATGFMATENHWPRVTLGGIDLDTVVRAMRMTRTYGVARTSGYIGRVEWFGGDPREGRPQAEIREAEIEVELTSAGLVFRYNVLTGVIEGLGPSRGDEPAAKHLAGAFTLPWEVLIIRAPALLEHRSLPSGAVGKRNGGLSATGASN